MTQPSDYIPPFPPSAAGRHPLHVVPASDSAEIDAARRADAARIQALENELASTRAELEQLQQLLAELPGIFERKFQQRLDPVLQQQHQLLEENAGLRDQMRQLPPAPAPVNPPWSMRSEPSLLMPSLPPRMPIRLARSRRSGPPGNEAPSRDDQGGGGLSF